MSRNLNSRELAATHTISGRPIDGSLPGHGWGDLYEVVISVTGPTGHTHPVRTAWIIRPADSRPQLVTAYVDLP